MSFTNLLYNFKEINKNKLNYCKQYKLSVSVYFLCEGGRVVHRSSQILRTQLEKLNLRP